MRKLHRALISIEFIVSFGVPVYLWIIGLAMFLLGLYSVLFSSEPVEFTSLTHFGIPVMFGAAGVWGALLLYFNAVFGYKAFGKLLEPIACGALGVMALLYFIFVFRLSSPVIAILPLACFAHLVWLNKRMMVANGI
ncbi:hypothetical protein HPT27_11550 [Permianibacter sp. IMCC34836]|uniref:hypothetical protein n=1 Tax=Permianibacter fluminis TaxID=2738515 RepID=UPI001557CCC8|nr:hypothetical protein [Permianibacter fluminis]NQD37661.1 hypothetical protein [Permianibacter fluminis]